MNTVEPIASGLPLYLSPKELQERWRCSRSSVDRIARRARLVELAKLDIKAPGPNDLINFYGPAGTFERLPLYRLIGKDTSAARAVLHDKIILLGYQSLSRGRGVTNKDEYDVTVSRSPMFGLEIHANIVGNLIDRSWLRRPSPKVEQMRLFLATLFVVGLAMHLERTKGVALAVLAGCSSVALDYYILFAHQYWLSGIGPFLRALRDGLCRSCFRYCEH
jgi:CHASE2 domain-containing sensor protein